MAGIDKQLAYYESNCGSINSMYSGKYIVIDESLNIKAFDQLSEAYNFGCDTFGIGNFMLKHLEQVTSVKTIHFVTPTITVL